VTDRRHETVDPLRLAACLRIWSSGNILFYRTEISEGHCNAIYEFNILVNTHLFTTVIMSLLARIFSSCNRIELDLHGVDGRSKGMASMHLASILANVPFLET